MAARKRWIGFTVKPRGRLLLDVGAREAVHRKGRSLLGHRRGGGRGDLSQRRRGRPGRGPDGVEFARGLTNYGDEDLRKIKGLRTGQIADALGHCPYDEVIHRDNMVITREKDGSPS